MQPLTHWSAELLACDDGFLSDELHDRILALGERAREKLIEFATDPRYRGSSGEGGGWVPVNAIELLRALAPDDATAARLVEALVVCDDEETEHSLAEALAEMGRAAVGPLIAALAAVEDSEVAGSIAAALAWTELRDDDVRASLEAAFRRFPHDVGPHLGSTADPYFALLIRADLAARFVGSGSSPRSDGLYLDLCDGLADLGMALTPAEESKRALAQMREERRAAREAPELGHEAHETDEDPPAVRPLPNEPCPCGSGRKFKKCHEGDEDALPG